MTNPDPGEAPLTPLLLERKIGATVFTVSGRYSETATENAVGKMRRILLKEAEKVKEN